MLEGTMRTGSATRESAPASSRLRPEFRGTAGEYFRIWIVNMALTVLTLGVYSAWAKVRKLRYFYANTTLAGSAFGYHGEPLAILKGRLIGVALLAVYFGASQFSPIAGIVVVALLGLAMPWLLVRSRMFAMRMTSWRGLRFGFREDYAGAYKVILGWGIAAIASFGLLIPLFICERYRFVITRTAFGSEAFDCKVKSGRFFKTYLVAGGITLLLILPLGALIGGGSVFAARGGLEQATLQMLTVAAFVVFYLVLFTLVGGYVQSRNLNEVFGNTSLAQHRLHSEMRARSLMGLYLTNTLAIVFTLGLAIPWAQIRLARYRLQTLELEVHGSLDAFVAAVAARPSATGEEISELFDVEVGL